MTNLRVIPTSELVGQKVRVYWNLHKHCYSVMQKGLVVAHTNHLSLYDCKFIVNERLRQKVIATKRKVVHAFVEGRVLPDDFPIDAIHAYTGWVNIRYNPYKNDSFMVTIPYPTSHKWEQPVKFNELVSLKTWTPKPTSGLPPGKRAAIDGIAA